MSFSTVQKKNKFNNPFFNPPLSESTLGINLTLLPGGFLFPIALLDGDRSKEVTLQVKPGQDVMVCCHFAVLTRQQSFFCKEPCRQTTALFGRGNTKMTSGRRSVRLIGAARGGGSVFVSVVAVTPSDSGRYRCGVGAQTYRTFVLSVAGSEFPVGPGQDSVPLSCSVFRFSLFVCDSSQVRLGGDRTLSFR